MPRVRQFGEMRQSRSTHKQLSTFHSQINKPDPALSHASSVHSHYVCVNCVNKSMSQQKMNFRSSQLQLDQSRYRQLQQSRQTHKDKYCIAKNKKMQEEKKKTVQYNKFVVEIKMQEKEKQKNQKQSQKKNIELQQRNFDKQIEDEERRAQIQKERWRNEITKQVQQKNQRILRQQMKDRYRPPAQEDKTWIQNMTKERQQKYRNQLLNQIKEEQQKRKFKKDEDKKEIDREYRLLDVAEERARKLQLQQEQRKRILLEDAREKQKAKQQRKIDDQMKLQRERVQLLIAKECEERTRVDNQKKKIERTNKYMSEIRNQMIEQQRRKKEELNWNKMNNTSASFVDQRPIDERRCDDCERIYPKSYLTKVKN